VHSFATIGPVHQQNGFVDPATPEHFPQEADTTFALGVQAKLLARLFGAPFVPVLPGKPRCPFDKFRVLAGLYLDRATVVSAIVFRVSCQFTPPLFFRK